MYESFKINRSVLAGLIIAALMVTGICYYTTHSTQEEHAAFAVYEKQPAYKKALINTYLNDLQKASDDFYADYFTMSPHLQYFTVALKGIEMKGSDSYITFVSEPFVGPHDTIGTDEVTFLASYTGEIKLAQFRHKKSYSVPENLKHLVKKPLPGKYEN